MPRGRGEGEQQLDKHSKNELRIFKKFAESCPYPIDFESIEKRSPPEPDILCRLSDGTALAFELMECIDASLSRSIYHSCELGMAFRERIERLPKNEKDRIKSHFQISVRVVFRNEIPLRRKRSLVKPIFDLLWTEDNEKRIRSMKNSFASMTPQEARQFTEILEKENITQDELLKRPPFSKSVPQSFDLKIPRELKDNVKSITCTFPSFFRGPSFAITDALWRSNPIEKRVREKTRKKYATEHITEFLVYYDLKPELPDYDILAELEFIDINNTIFRKLWIYSVREDRIIYNPLDFLIGASLAVPKKGIIKQRQIKAVVQQLNRGDRK